MPNLSQAMGGQSDLDLIKRLVEQAQGRQVEQNYDNAHDKYQREQEYAQQRGELIPSDKTVYRPGQNLPLHQVLK